MTGTGRRLEEGRRAIRSLRRSWRSTALSVALLTLGIASASAVLSVGDALVRRPLPVKAEKELVVPFGTQGDGKRLDASAVDLESWRLAPSLSDLAAALPSASTVEVDGRPQRVRSATAEPRYLPLLGVEPLAGRLFDWEETRSGARRVVVGAGLADRLLGGAEAAVGATLHVGGEPWEVVGVVPAEFDLPAGAELWMPLDLSAVPEGDRTWSIYQPVARLVPGGRIEDVRAELELIARRVAELHPDTHAGWTASAISFRRQLLGDPNGDVERSANVTLWGSLLLLLIACANVAQLEFVRAASRRRELGMRIVLGASRAGLAREAAIAIAGQVAVAVLLAAPGALALAEALAALGPASTTAFSGRLLDASVDLRVVAGFGLLAVVAALVAGVGPVLRIARRDDAIDLPTGERSTTTLRTRRLLDGAVVGQTALAVALLAATLAIVESYARMRGQDFGFQPENASYYELSLSPIDYGEPERRAAFVDGLMESIEALPGVRHAGLTTNLPLQSANWIAGYRCPDRATPDEEPSYANDRFVTPGYASALGLRLVAGRFLSPTDAAGGDAVVVVNRTLARDCWQEADPIGRTVERVTRSGARPVRVVGVVADPREMRVRFRAPHAVWYLPYDQQRPTRDLYLLIRGEASAATVRAAVEALDPHQPISGPFPLAAPLDEVTGTERMAAVVMTYFALLGLLLVGVGLFGSLARHVTNQRDALGVRLAFGADPGALAGLVVRRSLALACLGAVPGLVAGLALVRVTEGIVHETVLTPPLRFAAAVAVALALALAAAAGPAVRASRIQPARLLRE